MLKNEFAFVIFFLSYVFIQFLLSCADSFIPSEAYYWHRDTYMLCPAEDREKERKKT